MQAPVGAVLGIKIGQRVVLQLNIFSDSGFYLVRILTFHIDIHIVVFHFIIFGALGQMPIHPLLTDNQLDPACGTALLIYGSYPCLGEHLYLKPLCNAGSLQHLPRPKGSDVSLPFIQLPVLKVLPEIIGQHDGFAPGFLRGYAHIPAVARISLLSQGTQYYLCVFISLLQIVPGIGNLFLIRKKTDAADNLRLLHAGHPGNLQRLIIGIPLVYTDPDLIGKVFIIIG